MKRIVAFGLVLVLSLLVGCASQTGEAGNSMQISDEPETSQNEERITSASSVSTPGEIREIPSEYFQTADKQGTLYELSYDTYESFSYEEGTRTLTKRAIIYLPYGYSDSERYDVFYLMHGGWSNETTTLSRWPCN